MTINKVLEGNKLTLAVKGRLDAITSPDLETVIRDSVNGVNELVFDFAELDYISSAGLRVLLSSLKIMKKQGSMKLIHVNNVIMDILDITGFSDILTIE